MGSCLSKPQKTWEINPLNYMNNTDDICVICHLEIRSQDFCFFTCCKQFIHTECKNMYKNFCKNNNKKYKCPICRS